MSNPGSDPNAIVASTLVRLMRARGLTMAALADNAKIEPRRLEGILEAREEATAEDLLRLAGSFGVEPGELLAGVAWVPGDDGAGEYRAPERGE